MFSQNFNDLMEEIYHLNDTSYKFDYAIGKFVSDVINHTEFEKMCLSEIEQNSPTKRVYIIFYALCTYYRRNKRLHDMDNLLRMYKVNFHTYQSFEFLCLLCDMNMYKYEDKQYLIKRAEDICETWNKDDANEKNLNVKHAFAEIVANVYELTPSAEIINRRIIERAYNYVNQLCAKTNYGIYAKYYCTKARILSLKASITVDKEEAAQLYTEALEAIDIALREEIHGLQFLVRIEEYERYGAMIKSKYEILLTQKDIKLKYDEQIKNLKESTSNTIELLGLFTAVIALIIGTLQITVNFTYFQTASLIILLGGIILIVYSSLEILLHSFTKRECMIMVLGTFMVSSMLLIAFINLP